MSLGTGVNNAELLATLFASRGGESYGAADDEGVDDEGVDDEGLDDEGLDDGEAVSRRPRMTARQYSRGIGGVSNATVQTGNGPVQLRFQERLVTERELKEALSGVRSDVQGLANRVQQVDTQQARSTAALAKKADRLGADQKKQAKELQRQTKELRKQLESTKQMILLMNLMTPPPAPKKLEGQLVQDSGATSHVVMNVNSSEITRGDNMLTTLLLVSGGSLFGGGENNMLMSAAALGAFSK